MEKKDLNVRDHIIEEPMNVRVSGWKGNKVEARCYHVNEIAAKETQ